MLAAPQRHQICLMAVLLFIALALSLMAAFNQVKAMGLGWQEANYLPILRNAAFEGGYDSNGLGPLVPSLVAIMTSAAESVGVPRASGSVLVVVRIGLNLTLMLVCLGYCRQLGIGKYAVVLGWAALAWSLTHTTHQSTLAFDSTMEGILCMALAWACLAARRSAAIAAAVGLILNGNAFLPMGIILLTMYAPGGRPIHERLDRQTITRLAIIAGGAGLLLLAGGVRPEIAQQFRINLFSTETWLNLGLTFGVLPFLALLGWRKAPRSLQSTIALMLPFMLIYRFALHDAAATHGFIAPLVVCVLPLGLLALEAAHPLPGEARGTPVQGVHQPQLEPSCSLETSG
ncbi:MAG: hypothetical protein RLZZ303_3738 [Candidatus Hydrogenedentota bacterium]|jgi:hypothetical protein